MQMSISVRNLITYFLSLNITIFAIIQNQQFPI